MLAALFAPSVIAALFREGADLFKQYQDGKITLAQLQMQLGVIAMQEATKVEQANAEMVAKTYAAFSEVLKFSPLVRIVYAVVTLSQAFVLFWYQWAVPFIVWKFGGSFPPASDVLLEWGYGLLVLLVGGGAVAIKRPRQPVPAPSNK
jgi:hypothetical protein